MNAKNAPNVTKLHIIQENIPVTYVKDLQHGMKKMDKMKYDGFEVTIKNPSGGFPLLWGGICRGCCVVWLDLDNFFSIDIGRWFIRLYVKLGQVWFCRYLGVIV